VEEKIMVWQTLIDGAVCMADMEVDRNRDNPRYRFPSMDKSYKYAILTDELSNDKDFFALLVSKDSKDFKLALRILQNGKEYGINDIAKKMDYSKMMWSAK
jgi:hypothetical protein